MIRSGHFLVFLGLLLFQWFFIGPPYETEDYAYYHKKVNLAENHLAKEEFKAALVIYEELFEDYDFVFLREYQVATQLAIQLDLKEKASQLLRKGIKAGWTLKSINRNKYLSDFRKTTAWKSIKKEYDQLIEQHEASLNLKVQNRVKKMFSQDQRKAIGALFKIGSKAQDRYAEKKFAPHSEVQMASFKEIIEEYGYPGEQLIGNDIWMSTILSHHNSISKEYVNRDTLYASLRPELIKAINKGQMAPFEFALIDDWKRAVANGREAPEGYGILFPPLTSTLENFNALRASVYMRSIELRNQLVDVEEKYGIELYLPGEPWIEGKIEIRSE